MLGSTVTNSGSLSPHTAPSGDISAQVRAIVADVTRYPIDILEPTADIEEELGIDSVKLGEILSVLRERFHLPPVAELRSRVPATQLRTIGGIADAVAFLAGGAYVAPTTPPTSAFAVPAPQRDAVEPLIDEVRRIFAELTRYPLDILSPDADLEDDLGIDSVKLGEIFSVLRERYALPPRTELRDRITPAQLRTIQGITGIVTTFGNVSPIIVAAPAVPTPVVVQPSVVAQLRVVPQPPVVARPVVVTQPPVVAQPPAAAPSVVAQQPVVASPRTATSAPDTRTRTITWTDPSVGADAAKTMSGIEYLRAMVRRELPAPPIASLLDFEITEIERGHTVFEVSPAEYHYNPIGVVHGGLAATVLDSAMASAVHTTLPAGTGYTTLEFKINLVRPLTAGVGRLRAIADVVHDGGRIATAEARLVDAGGVLYAHATETCLIVEHGPRK